MRELILNGYYQHFKGHEYKIIHFAQDCDTLEVVVVYQDINNPEKIWVRKYDEFNSFVDKEKYPNINQEYRFQEKTR